MAPEDLSVLVRRVGSVLDIRLVSALERVTFELVSSDQAPDTADISCGETEEVEELVDNQDGTFSITVSPNKQCRVSLQLLTKIRFH